MPDHNSENNNHHDSPHDFNWKHPTDYYDFVVHTLKLNERTPRNTTAREALFGLSEGLFMFQPREHSSCLTDGNAFFVALIGLVKRMPEHHYYLEEQDQFNWEDVAN